MDDQAATKVIAAIERLSNRIAKLDETSVESAVIANEARRAAMDAAEATDATRTADRLAAHVKPLLGRFDDQFDRKMDTLDQNIQSFFSETQMNVDRMKSAARDTVSAASEHRERSKNLLIAIGFIGFFFIVIAVLSAWIFHDQLLRSRTGCEVFGGIYKWTAEAGSFCLISAG
jgi:hypothetical protein